ncbi:MAG TPA: class I SAM-dependent methyltransferase [Verrucomicrobiales bacterium]|nr:class I SAM-dependent methyltransferase [Verrucomicrobiales bacterium]
MDTLELYRWAVQDPETHAVVLRTMYERLRPGRHPAILREDFAGTAAESIAWVALKKGRRAIAVDLDAQTLEWARCRAAHLLGPRSSNVSFVCGDARLTGPPEVPHADILAVLNFSICYQHDPDELQSYLRHALDVLAPDGILVLNLFGGAEAVRAGTTRHRVAPNPRLPGEAPVPEFEYLWEVRSCDAESRRLDCRIHFAVPDPTASGRMQEIRDAFSYDFRLWSVKELVRACGEAGFTDVQVWRHTYDALKGEDGVFLGSVEPQSLDALENWTAYVVAAK